MAGNVAKPTLVIPTGFEARQREIARRNELAQFMLKQGLESDPNMTSPLQVLGHLAQAWAGKSMQKSADQQSTGLEGDIRTDYLRKIGEFQKDVQSGMAEGDLVAKYGSDPMLESYLKPHQEAYQSRLVGDQRVEKNGDMYQRAGELPGTYARSSAQDELQVNPVTGQVTLNEPKIAANRLSQGMGSKDIENFATTGTLAPRQYTGPQGPAGYPGVAPQPFPGQGQSGNQPEQIDYQSFRELSSFPGDVAKKILTQQNYTVRVNSLDEAENLPPGTTYIRPDGVVVTK